MLTSIFLNDGNIETHEYQDNYFFYDANKKNLEKEIKLILKDSTLQFSKKKQLLKKLCEQTLSTQIPI